MFLYSQRGFEVLNATFQASVYVTIVKQPPEVFYVLRNLTKSTGDFGTGVFQ